MLTDSCQINKKETWMIFGIFAVAFLLRALYFIDYRNTDIYPILCYSDSYSSFIWAKDIASGDIWGAHAFMKWPLYAYFLGFLFRVSGNNINMVYALQSMLGAANCILIYFIARILFNKAVAFIAGVLCCLYGLFIFYDGLLIYTSLSLFLNSLFFLCLLQVQDNLNKSTLFWLGIFLGICTITQANIIVFGCLAIFWVLWEKRIGLASSIKYFSCFITGLFIVVGLVVLRNYLVEKDFVLIQGNTGINFYLGNNPQSQGEFDALFFTPNQDSIFKESRIIARIESGRQIKTSEVSGFWMKRSLDFIRTDTSSYLKLILRKTVFLLSPREFIHDHEFSMIKDKIRIFKALFLDLKFILPFALLGIILGLGEFRKNALLYLVIITLSLSIILFFVTTRYRIAIVPFLIIFAAYAIYSLWRPLQKKQIKKFVLYCLILIFLSILFNHGFYNKPDIKYAQAQGDFMYHFQKALMYENDYKLKKALEELEAAQSISPGRHYIVFAFGSVYYHMNNLKMAEEKFKEAIKIFPYYIDPYYNLGFMYNQEHRFNEAIDILNKGTLLDPEDAGIHFELGKSYSAKGDTARAGKELVLALAKINRWRSDEKAMIAKELSRLK